MGLFIRVDVSSARTVILWVMLFCLKENESWVRRKASDFLLGFDPLLTVFWQWDRVRHAKFSQEYVTHFFFALFLLSSYFFFSLDRKSIVVNNARVQSTAGYISEWVECAEMIWEWCLVQAAPGSLRITKRIIESIKPVKWETAASLTALISLGIECSHT